VGFSLVESKDGLNNEINSTSDRQKKKDNILTFVILFDLGFGVGCPST
jgi:hypothetical protein